ncbi:galanin receptor 2a-like [Paramacrobiotus metropolitanus]|uniref:galanin receptor 2a-like n=1 Tax=Paramacrobiotus metropolitanus TaxID=2943436 RepID=UPI002445AEC1|nr:galanin receptor 2a-like [Paramacrobiotus metropolitanus]XP_055357791.1 galanin receptor 2a-like [Paramacrobiotus metropolitanus]XP_055357792.1 galanin receptor 2a-like [Paramacrobiotus metropolitanus]XP_055357793.1 galanin receptor 2a-like [Paramacrobiotus metropolitanus]
MMLSGPSTDSSLQAGLVSDPDLIIPFDNISSAEPFSASNVTLANQQWMTIWCIANLFLCAFGALLCFLLIVVIMSDKTARIGSGCLIAHLLVIDLMMCAIHLPINTIWVFATEIFAGLMDHCAVVFMTFQTTAYAGSWVALFLALNRFTAIILPLKYGAWSTNNTLAKMTISSWFMAFLCTVPFCFGIGGTITTVPPWSACGVRKAGSNVVFTLSKVTGMYAPLIIVCVIYIAMFSWLAVRRTNVVRLRSVETILTEEFVKQRRTCRRRLIISKMLFVSSVWQCACYLPYMIISSNSQMATQMPVLDLILRSVFHTGYATNPLIFLLMSDNYWKGLRRVIHNIGNCLPADTGSRRSSATSSAGSFRSRTWSKLSTDQLVDRIRHRAFTL